MEKSNQVQIALLGVVVLMLGYLIFTGGFGGSSDNSTSEREKARQNLQASNPSLANDATAKPAEPAAPVGPTTSVDFNEKEFHFGNITAGEKVNHTFKFKNTGKEPLIISNAKGSCGCTVPQWPKEPIAPGESGEIEVAFDSKGKSGNQTKNVTITANTEPANTILKISADVAKDPNAPATPAATAAPTITPTTITPVNK